MPYRKVPLAENEIYHVCSKSIANFKIFNCAADYERMVSLIAFYLFEDTLCSFSRFKAMNEKSNRRQNIIVTPISKLVDMAAYCLMPTHIHFILKEIKKDGISKFMNVILKSYSKYFNFKHRRKGPLWEGPFTNITIQTDYQLNHVHRYIHLNPVSARIVNDPKEWKYSSYGEYVRLINENDHLCNFTEYLDMNVEEYTQFVNDQIGYQRTLADIKRLTLE